MNSVGNHSGALNQSESTKFVRNDQTLNPIFDFLLTNINIQNIRINSKSPSNVYSTWIIEHVYGDGSGHDEDGDFDQRLPHDSDDWEAA